MDQIIIFDEKLAVSFLASRIFDFLLYFTKCASPMGVMATNRCLLSD